MPRIIATLLIIGAWLWPAATAAQPASRVAVSLHAESTTPAPGRTTTLAIRFRPQAGWHGYWSNPGDSGLPPTATWSVSTGIGVGALRHPAPTTLRVAGLTSYVHAGEHVLLAPMTVPRGLTIGTPLPVKLDLDFLICSDSLCVPQKATARLDLVVGDGRSDATTSGMIAAARRALPVTAGADGTFSQSGDDVRLLLPASARITGRQVAFYPAGQGVFQAKGIRFLPDGSAEISGSMPIEAKQVSGVVSDGRRSVTINFDRSAVATTPALVANDAKSAAATVATMSERRIAAPPPAAIPKTDGAAAIPQIGLLLPFLGALIGGLLLNLMPCVFPILSLKAMHLVRSGASPVRARREGIGYAAGVIAACLALGAVLLALREAGVAAGWSFQLQNPYVIVGLLLLMLVTALNLAGLFAVSAPSLGLSAANEGVVGSFATGALAAVIATPCSAPFMASALGAALVLPALQALLIFAALGLGFSLPFLLIALVPALQSRLPKPGGWMSSLQRVLSIPMFLTAIGLAWVLGKQVGIDALALALLASLFVGLGLWWTGHRQRQVQSRRWLPLLPATLLAAFTIAFIPAVATTASTLNLDRAEVPFSESRLAELRRSGTPVFVDFTADWCLTCKVNDRIAIEREATQAAFARHGVVTMVGDWTRGDPAITRFLAGHGRNSIPFYLFYAPGKDVRVLPQLLTSEGLVAMAAGTPNRE